MRKYRSLIVAGVLGVVLAGGPAAGYSVTQRSVDELLLMNESELLTQAELACGAGAAGLDRDAVLYLDRIRLVVRKRGKETGWLVEMMTAVGKRDQDACHRIFTERLHKEAR